MSNTLLFSSSLQTGFARQHVRSSLAAFDHDSESRFGTLAAFARATACNPTHWEALARLANVSGEQKVEIAAPSY